MLVKLLGVLDILCSLVLFFSNFMPNRIIMTLAMLLFCKGMIFGMSFGSLASLVDAFAGIYIGLIAYGFNLNLVTLILAIHLLIKGVLSLIAR